MFSAVRITSIRKSRGYSQELLAEQSGVSLRTIQRVEQGETVPRGHTLQALAAALGVTLEDFRVEVAPVKEVSSGLESVDFAAVPTPQPPRFTVALTPAQEPQTVLLPEPAKRPDPHFLQLLNLSALSFLVLPFLNIVVPLLMWRAHRHDVEHANELGRRVLGFQILWQVGCFFAYLLLVLGHWVAARYFNAVVPGTYLGVFVLSYLVNVLTVGYYAVRLRGGDLRVYPIRL
ncbi:helix-turn-helix domain-containing protein [Hymenobacter koreensis]|uniref:HTH cro/C1-type domain-containing protein n=1 Tax=Hymenobacter koreensis TaxID=1084523 RepID=A0ABP8J910_9BACT